MADMASRIEYEARTAYTPSLQFHSFSCGCRRVSGPGIESRVEWCPYHEASHGQLVESPPAPIVPIEQIVSARRPTGRTTRSGER
jgi:hypothetical protein